eukprot:TRINITY_DN25154_c0_g1_i1.p2 TRINITY_DN25154_c0_g1~~TRINITY_DN25154_c0_g1_i1.p2  ORF type:complete len:112 (+),score=9.36 TRINITY_DN25154_c0_g1_i1:73-408(+)
MRLVDTEPVSVPVGLWVSEDVGERVRVSEKALVLEMDSVSVFERVQGAERVRDEERVVVTVSPLVGTAVDVALSVRDRVNPQVVVGVCVNVLSCPSERVAVCVIVDDTSRE